MGEIGILFILLPNNQRQHSILHAQKACERTEGVKKDVHALQKACKDLHALHKPCARTYTPYTRLVTGLARLSEGV